MSPQIVFVLSVAGLSACVTYALWMRYRVWNFRRDLFSIRDEVWAQMLEAGTLDDPSHQEFRAAVNALIGIAPMLSIVTFLRLVFEAEKSPKVEASPDELPQIVEATDRVLARFARYILFETVSGLAIVAVLRLFRMVESCRESIVLHGRLLLDNHSFETIVQGMSPVRRKAMEAA